MSGRPLYIFDLDGTLALTGHREGHVRGKKKDWAAFFAACDGDKPNVPVIRTFRSLFMIPGLDVEIWSGRSDEVRGKTEQWIARYVFGISVGEVNAAYEDFFEERLRMRQQGDHTPDHELKLRWLAGMPADQRQMIVAVFDDRDSVVAMWRKENIACFQVAPGGF